MPNYSKDVRDALGFSQDQLAYVLGVHSVTVSRWERGVLSPSPHQNALLLCFGHAAILQPEIGAQVAAVMFQRGAPFALYLLLAACFPACPGH